MQNANESHAIACYRMLQILWPIKVNFSDEKNDYYV